MTLEEILAGVEVRQRRGAPPEPLHGLHYDSRRIQPGQLFVAVRGEQVDGNRFVQAAAAQGASVVISEEPPPLTTPLASLPWVQVAQARRALAQCAANWYGRPSERLRMVGVTGTNGKTTTTFLVESVLRTSGIRTGMLGTIEYRIGSETLPAPHTTPESLDLQELLARMVAAGCKAVAMEASSHALAMDRTWGCLFEVAAFTNLTQDHLDYHGTMENYRRAKQRLFQGMGAPPPKAAVVNADDPASREMTRDFAGETLTYGFSEHATLRASRLENTPGGLSFHLRGPGGWNATVRSALLGRVNALNIMTAISCGLAMGLRQDQILAGIESLKRVPGRFERVDAGQTYTVIVDFAHTPDALTQVLTLAREVLQHQTHPGGRLLLVFGCGGERDRGKRPIMGEAASKGADWVMITSDNPRSEDPLLIINDVKVGVQRSGRGPAASEPDRRIAIEQAVAEARPGDLLLIAGKGHEAYQIVGDEHIPFNDAEVVRQAIKRRG